MLTPLENFFARYHSARFSYDPARPASEEFERLAESRGWSRQKKTYRWARQDFRSALVEQFNATFGEDENSLTGWQALCEVIGVGVVPRSVTEAKKLVRRTHVNVVDVTEARILGKTLTRKQKFKTVGALAAYTFGNEKVFPKHDAKAGGLLKYLLRQIS